MSKSWNATFLQIDEIYIYILDDLRPENIFSKCSSLGFIFLLIAVNVFSGFKSMSGKEVALLPISFYSPHFLSYCELL